MMQVERGTLAELKVRPGDWVECIQSGGCAEVGQRYKINESCDVLGWPQGATTASVFVMVSRAAEPAPADEIVWGEWQSEPLGLSGDFQYQNLNGIEQWRYPVKREPVVETVRLLTGKAYGWLAEPEGNCGDRNTHRITLTIIDGVVQPTASVEVLA